jgi:hypothetical protein
MAVQAKKAALDEQARKAVEFKVQKQAEIGVLTALTGIVGKSEDELPQCTDKLSQCMMRPVSRVSQINHGSL